MDTDTDLSEAGPEPQRRQQTTTPNPLIDEAIKASAPTHQGLGDAISASGVLIGLVMSTPCRRLDVQRASEEDARITQMDEVRAASTTQ